MPVPSTMTADCSYYDVTRGGYSREQELHQETAPEGRQDHSVHLRADYRGVPERDILRMVGGIQDDPVLQHPIFR